MKNLSLLILAFAISISASAQTSMDTTAKTKMHHAYNHSMGWYVMKDGKVMMMKNGASTALSQDATLSNGTTISTDGKVTWKDGKTATLQEGQSVDMNGKIHDRKGMHKM